MRNVDNVTESVRTRDEARKVIAQLLRRFGGDAANARVRRSARTSKQSSDEVALRAAGNLLTSFVQTRDQAD
jgi:hypothetical protein